MAGVRARLVAVAPYLALASGLLVADQASKFAAVAHLTQAFAVAPAAVAPADKVARFWTLAHPPPNGVVEVFESWWQFRYVENPGAAWGLLSRSSWRWRTRFFLAVSAVSLAAMGLWLWRSGPESRQVKLGLAAVLGGALGNLVDRARLGYVIDFIDWHWARRFYWPTFNVADACISVGVALLIIDSFRDRARR